MRPDEECYITPDGFSACLLSNLLGVLYSAQWKCPLAIAGYERTEVRQTPELLPGKRIGSDRPQPCCFKKFRLAWVAS